MEASGGDWQILSDGSPQVVPSQKETPMLTVIQVAERLQVSKQTVYVLIQNGRLATHRIGSGRGAIRVSEDDLDIYIQSTRQLNAEKQPRMSSVSRPKLKHIRL